MTRREAILTFGSAIPIAAQPLPKPKQSLICALSQALPGIGYAEIGEIVKQIGFDGIEISVMPHGLVEPSQAPVDEVRALESIHGAGLEAPIITTALRTATEPWARTVLALAGRTGVKWFRSPVTQPMEALGLMFAGREYKIALAADAAMGSVLAVRATEASGVFLDSRWFQANQADARTILPLVRSVVLADQDTQFHPTPLGKGEVPFSEMFQALRGANFSGPISVAREYKTSDEPGALRNDLEFVRKLVAHTPLVNS